MRSLVLVGGIIVMLAASARAQAPVFIDVPPWHWASDAVGSGAAAGVFRGYPIDDRDRAANALTQVYDAFVNSAHPRAREWAERFLVNLPANWPQPLERSRLAGFRLDAVRVDLKGERGTASFAATLTPRQPGGPSITRLPLRVEVRKDADGRWQIHYPDLAAGQPQVFR